MNKYILEITVFISGAVVMIFELLGSRILGPYFGTSIFVWTSLIGIVLGSLSIGYYLGGIIADKKPKLSILSLIIFLAGFLIIISVFCKKFLLLYLIKNFSNIKILSVIASLVLFMPTSILLGMVSPYAVKLKLENLDYSGKIIGSLYAISTLGSIVGTFLAGFYLIPFLGTNKLLIILSLILVILSLFLSLNNFKLKIFLIFIIFLSIPYKENKNFVLDTDTEYNRILIRDHYFKNKYVRSLIIDNGIHSSMFLDSKNQGLVFNYLKYYHLVKYFNPDFKNVLMIGGAGYSLPKNFLLKYPQVKIDVVEIDPKLTEIAKKYFRLKENKRLNIYHQDGRVFLNKTKNKYDAILGDAFNSKHSVPYQLTTREAVQKEYDILNNGGLVIINIASALYGKKSEFLRAEYATYKDIFPQVYIFAVGNYISDDIRYGAQNIILVALKSDKKFMFHSENKYINKLLKTLWTEKIDLDKPILTDDFVPVDYYINKTI